ncbi:MAG: SGNH/GDSL hydrolase family protein [Phycisphaeraceae bacterium]|nr:SGNH/GDSL hydrolase family protein [Phycisphaeraceae bacterium]
MSDPLVRKKVLIGYVAAAIVPALILLDTLVGFARGWRMVYRQEQAIVAGVAVWMMAAVLLVCVARGRAFYLKHWTRLVVLVFFSVLALAVAESVVRSLPTGDAPFHLRTPDHQWIFRPTPQVMPGITGDSRYTTNADGVRGPKMPLDKDSLRVLCLGGSTTECLYLDDDETWTHLLTSDLETSLGRPVWTGSAGASGLASDAHLLFVENSDLMSRVSAIVLLVGINDLSKALVSPTPDAVGELARPELVGRPIWRRSVLLIRGGVLVKQLLKKLKGDQLNVEDEGGASYISRRERRRTAAKTDDVPNFDAAIESYRHRIEKIADVCARKNVKLILVTQPVLWDESLGEKERNLLWFGWLDDGRYLSITVLRATMDRYNKVLREIAARRSIALADLASMNGRSELFIDDCHFNEAGAREVSRLIAPVVAGVLLEKFPGGGK